MKNIALAGQTTSSLRSDFAASQYGAVEAPTATVERWKDPALAFSHRSTHSGDSRWLVNRVLGSSPSRRATEVSALEPLVDPRELPPQVTALVDRAIKELTGTTALCNSHKKSLCVRLNALKKQSIGQSLRQFIGTWLPSDAGAQKIVGQAYDVRSRILHRGKPVEDLEAQCQALETVIRNLYRVKLEAPAVRAKATTGDRRPL